MWGSVVPGRGFSDTLPDAMNMASIGATADNNGGNKNSQVNRPEWVRLPKPGQHCNITGLGRSFLAKLVREGKVDSISLRERGAKKGVRLIRYDSLMAFIEKMGRLNKEDA